MFFFQDKRIAPDNELSDSEDEGGPGGVGVGGGRRDNRSFKAGAPRKRPRLDKQEAAPALNSAKDEIKCEYLIISQIYFSEFQQLKK